MMPADLTGDPIGPTGLCAHHKWAIAEMSRHGHVNAEATEQATTDLVRQCCAWRPKETK